MHRPTTLSGTHRVVVPAWFDMAGDASSIWCPSGSSPREAPTPVSKTVCQCVRYAEDELCRDLRRTFYSEACGTALFFFGSGTARRYDHRGIVWNDSAEAPAPRKVCSAETTPFPAQSEQTRFPIMCGPSSRVVKDANGQVAGSSPSRGGSRSCQTRFRARHCGGLDGAPHVRRVLALALIGRSLVLPVCGAGGMLES